MLVADFKYSRSYKKKVCHFTCANDLLNLHTGGIYLFGELPDCLIGVLVRERVNVYLHSWRHLRGETKAIHMLHKTSSVITF